MNQLRDTKKACFHLPGLFEWNELYEFLLTLYQERREYFYEWCEIGSLYGAPGECLWGGGRISEGDAISGELLRLLNEAGISMRLTFSNSLIREEHLADWHCNELCRFLEKNAKVPVGIIVHSDLLMNYLTKHYPGFYFISSTTKVITDAEELKRELNREEFRYVVPDFRFNPNMELWSTLSDSQKEKVEFLCNECCEFGCLDRKACYEAVSRKQLGEESNHICKAAVGQGSYRFSRAMQNPGFISIEDIQDIYLPAGFTNFKIEGRGLNRELVFEMLLYYLIKPQHHLEIRELYWKC